MEEMMMRPKYGGPHGGRPMLGKRASLKKAKVAEMMPGEKGRHYLVGARGHVANQKRKAGTLTVSPKVKRQLRG